MAAVRRTRVNFRMHSATTSLVLNMAPINVTEDGGITKEILVEGSGAVCPAGSQVSGAYTKQGKKQGRACFPELGF